MSQTEIAIVFSQSGQVNGLCATTSVAKFDGGQRHVVCDTISHGCGPGSTCELVGGLREQKRQRQPDILLHANKLPRDKIPRQSLTLLPAASNVHRVFAAHLLASFVGHP
jgi:hypothetical protein